MSPINGINRALVAELEAELGLPVYFGNRNWDPYVEETVATMRDNGVRRAAVFTTSAWSGYSSCTQYVEDIARARRAAGPRAPELVKLRPYFDHPLFVEMFAGAIAAAASTVPAGARLVFTAHSVPVAADRRCGPNLYSRQVAYAASLVAAAAGYADYDLAWQSRSGPPQVPWLEPDVADHLAALAADGVRSSWSALSGSSPTTSRWCGTSTTSCGRRPRRRESRWPGPAPQRRPPIRPVGGGFDRRTAFRPRPERVSGPEPVAGCLASVNGEPCLPPHCAALPAQSEP